MTLFKKNMSGEVTLKDSKEGRMGKLCDWELLDQAMNEDNAIFGFFNGESLSYFIFYLYLLHIYYPCYIHTLSPFESCLQSSF